MAKGDLFVGGVKMPPLKALTITHEKVWSSNTGRAADGTMIGDLICLKYKLQAEFVPSRGNCHRRSGISTLLRSAVLGSCN